MSRPEPDKTQAQDVGEDLNPLADPKCPACHGKGYVTDWVPYGSGNVPMDTVCECVEDEEE